MFCKGTRRFLFSLSKYSLISFFLFQCFDGLCEYFFDCWGKGIFFLDRVLAWIESQGLEQVEATNRRKAGALYELLDSSDFWVPIAEQGSRSLMNVSWKLSDTSLESQLISDGLEAGFSGIKGHRSVGGLRASIYNACPEASVTEFVAFLREFERKNG